MPNQDQTEGKLKKGAGKLTGDDQLQAEGKQQQTKGDTKRKVEDAKRTVTGAAKNARDTVTDDDR